MYKMSRTGSLILRTFGSLRLLPLPPSAAALAAAMSFKAFLGFITLVTAVSAANFKRVACPDGKNTATNAACCAFFSLRDDLQENLFVTSLF